METQAVKKFAHEEVVCRGCGYIIRKEMYVVKDGKAYHKKCEPKKEGMEK